MTELDTFNINMAHDWNLVIDPSRDYHNYKLINNPKANKKKPLKV